MTDGQPVERYWRGFLRRSLGELLVIIVGVLVALAADRWNQARADGSMLAAYEERLMEGIRMDSLEAASVVQRLPTALAALDSLRAVREGGREVSSAFSEFIFATFLRPDWKEPVAWTELQSAGLLSLIEDLELREALSTYYASRQSIQTLTGNAERRGRDPYLEALYPLGLMLSRHRLARAQVFVESPGMEGLLYGLESYFGLLETGMPNLEEAAGQALIALGR